MLALVTGGYSGIGLETTLALARRGFSVVVPARRPEVAQAALGTLAEVDVLDLADLDSVRLFADRFLASGRTLDLVIANAGIMACPETRVGPGWEAQLATNHLGHFALVNRLWPAIAGSGSARVVVVASGVGRIHWEDVMLTRGYDRWEAYGQAKTANRLFAAQLDLFGQPSGVRAFSVHPGYILTPLQRHLTAAEMVEAGWIDDQGQPSELFKTPAEGAATQVWAATSPELEGRGGLHCEDSAVVGPIAIPGTATDPADALRLWDLSADLTGVDAFRQ